MHRHVYARYSRLNLRLGGCGAGRSRYIRCLHAPLLESSKQVSCAGPPTHQPTSLPAHQHTPADDWAASGRTRSAQQPVRVDEREHGRGCVLRGGGTRRRHEAEKNKWRATAKATTTATVTAAATAQAAEAPKRQWRRRATAREGRAAAGGRVGVDERAGEQGAAAASPQAASAASGGHLAATAAADRNVTRTETQGKQAKNRKRASGPAIKSQNKRKARKIKHLRHDETDAADNTARLRRARAAIGPRDPRPGDQTPLRQGRDRLPLATEQPHPIPISCPQPLPSAPSTACIICWSLILHASPTSPSSCCRTRFVWPPAAISLPLPTSPSAPLSPSPPSFPLPLYRAAC